MTVVDTRARLEEELRNGIATVPDFPVPGIQFKDIAPLLARPGIVQRIAAALAADVAQLQVDTVLAIDARGFVVGAPLADRLGAGFVMVRKPGKLPGRTLGFDYACEYCTGRLEITDGTVRAGARCLVVDDLLATGGTARATADCIVGLGGAVVGYCFLVELAFLGGRTRLADAPVASLLTY